MELQLYIQQLPQLNVQGQQIHFDGPNPAALSTVLGPLPPSRQFPQYGTFINITQYISDPGISITFSAKSDNEGYITPGADQQKKAFSGAITFEGEAYRLIRQWLVDDVSASLNNVEVKLLHVGCGYYEGFKISPLDLQWCEGDICTFQITMKQVDEPLNCIKRTLIADNWQGWFQSEPANGKKHPRFSYCNEQRPNGMMIALWYIMSQVLGPLAIVMMVVTAIIALIAAIINAIISVINTLGGNLNFLNVPNPLAVFESFSIYFIETAGCGREHPAALIRDYITNVCDKCGISVDATTAPIFFAQSITIETSSRGVLTMPNPHYMATYFFATVKRGIRRFKSINIIGSSLQNTTDFWIPDNNPLLALDQFLDQLAPVYNAAWRIRTVSGIPYLYFQRKDYWKSGNYIFDFTTNGADRHKLLEGICYEPYELRYPAYVKGAYAIDPGDSCGNEVLSQMNGIVGFGSTENNPNYEGFMDKTTVFGGTRFNLDGAATCYYYDALQQLANSGLLNLTVLFQTATIASALADYGDYALLLRDETCTAPKIIIWDGESYTNARAVKPKSTWPGVGGLPMPDSNPTYNTTAWNVKHPPQTFVLGSGLTLGPSPDGVYLVSNYFNAPIAEKTAYLVNFPMYFEPGYYDTTWDWFHWIDDPRYNLKKGYTWYGKIALCCEDLNILGVLSDASDISLGEMVKANIPYYDHRIEEIEVNYDVEDTHGMHIKISGTV